ncbi:MAG TPA: DinB family protein [Bryobacteraceae bacterium]|nr:DinB family protein [Bryobacteraceae bacterium]
MAPQERTEIVNNLERSRAEFLATLEGLTDAQARVKPGPDRWSVLECLEHVTFVEDRFYGWLEKAAKLDSPRRDREKELRLMAMVPDRTTRAKSPEAALPTGRWTLQEAIDEFNARRDRSVRFAAEHSNDLYSLAAEHPRFGPVNGVELLIISAGHARRHAEQIRETRAELEKS